MNIILQNNNEIEDVKNLSKLIWKRYQNGFLIYVLFLALSSSFLIYIGIKNGYDFQSSFDLNGNMNSKDCENYFYNFNFTLGLGISFIFVLLLMLIVFVKQKKRFNNQKISKLSITDISSERIITNQYYEFKSEISTRKHQWKFFESYKELNNFLILNNYKKVSFHTEFINLNLLNTEEKTELHEVLKNNNIVKE